jgi:hypothetical protein
MNSNRHSLNCIVVDLIEIHNFGLEFTSILIYIKTLNFRSQMSIFLSIEMISNDKSIHYKVVASNETTIFV